MTSKHATALLWGEEEFLLRLGAGELFREAGVRPTEIDAGEWVGGETSDLATPSLWGEPRALLVTGCQGLSEAAAKEVRGYIGAPSPDALCVLTWVTRGKNAPPLAKAVQAGGGLVRQVAIKRQDLPRWVGERAKLKGMQLVPAAANALVGTVGEDPAVLEQSLEQLASAFPGRSLGPAEVRAQFQGLGEQRVWDLCDQALTGHLPQALVVLRSLLEAREDPLLILGGIAARIRDLIRIRSLPDRLPPAEAARASGIRFDWQLRRYREQASRFSPEELAELHAQIVDADRALKGGSAGDVVLPTVVAGMAGVRSAALEVSVRVSR
jgi:DNA polymerase-3 subunit delta